jgi:hypothetical protein
VKEFASMFRWFPQVSLVSLVIAGALALSASPACGGYTAVAQPKRHGEVSHEQILEKVYGGDFVVDPTGLSFSNGSGVTVTRLEDGSGAATDAPWSGKTITARAVAAFSGKHRTAGYFAATSAGDSQQIFDASGRNFDVTGAGDSGTQIDGELLLATGRGRRVKVFCSDVASNSDGMDHLVTYQVKGTGQPASVYLLCWEGKLARQSDRDYNDLVVEVQAAEIAARAPFTQPLLIPLPPPAWAGLAGLLGLASVASFRKRRTR